MITKEKALNDSEGKINLGVTYLIDPITGVMHSSFELALLNM